ncbi:Hypothetical protein R9X50_00591600 [Acrodontium crateriforme]|uniref:THO complex subunit 5 n=1 Tax=Acrodontium crateriforme TaxID=150365 RepID=A0AAQ3M733_9PEZI|nr:Hypothetical protein R9X50_00591600 [Acrodontium crateriforme]
MATESLITDPALVSVLQSAAQARQQSLAILDLLEEYHARNAQEESLEDQLALSKQQKILNAHLAQLRGLNRNAIMGVRSTKQATAEARQEIDSLHLQLQNLYYEQRHLRGEITGCENYEHKYTQLPMIPTEDFLAQHPEHTSSSDHDLTIARIQDELAARQALDEQRKLLQAKKDGLVKETNAKKEELAKLDADIEKWIGGQESVRKTFEAREAKIAEAKEKEAAEREREG